MYRAPPLYILSGSCSRDRLVIRDPRIFPVWRVYLSRGLPVLLVTFPARLFLLCFSSKGESHVQLGVSDNCIEKIVEKLKFAEFSKETVRDIVDKYY